MVALIHHERRHAVPTACVFVLAIAVCIVALPPPASAAGTCPLSPEQTRKSVTAFDKLASFITHEPRCVNCHGGVNPHIDETGLDPEDPNAPPSIVPHGGDKQPRQIGKNGEREIPVGCQDCHNSMAPPTGGGKSRWMTAPPFMTFLGKTPTALCKQFRRQIPNAQEFLGHLWDDNGKNNFSGTAFNGDRGLDAATLKAYNVTIEKPRLTREAVRKLAQDWVDAQGGRFNGDEACGCVPDGWLLSYDVEIRGDGARGSGGGSKFSWTIDRLYAGRFELTRTGVVAKNPAEFAKMSPEKLAAMTPQQILDLGKQMTANMAGIWSPGAPESPINVVINDGTKSFDHGPGEGDSFEDVTTTRTYKGANVDEVRGASYTEDRVANTYNVSIRMRPTGKRPLVLVEESAEYTRSPFGFGDKPTHETINEPPKREPFGQLDIPDVKGLLENGGVIHHTVDQPVNFVNGALSFDSGWVVAWPLKPPFSDLPQPDRLKVRVTYKLTRLE